MKFNKKKLFVAALAICLVAIISMGTLAWFTDSDDVTNKFMIAESDDDTADDIFSVDVWEKDKDGNVYDEKDNEGGITYDDILPGDKLVKDVFVENTGYYAQYIRATVTVSDGIAWANVLGKVPADVELSDIVYGLNTDGLYGIVSKYESGKLIYELYYKDALTAGKTINVFDGVKIPESMTAEQATKFDNAFTIDVNAKAVQTENVGDNVVAAFATIEGVTPVMDKVYTQPDAAVTEIDLPTVDNGGTPVELRLYEVTSGNIETGNYIVIGTYDYTF